MAQHAALRLAFPTLAASRSQMRRSSGPVLLASKSWSSRDRAYSVTAFRAATPGSFATSPASTAKPSTTAKSIPQTANAAAPPSQQTPTTARSADASTPLEPINEYKDGLSDLPTGGEGETVNWSTSFFGLSDQAFPKEAAEVLLKPVDPEDVEVKPDGIVYLPEIKYRRILNQAFGPGAWGLAPRGETIVTARNVTREYALLVHGRLVSVARGEQQYFDPEGIPTAVEGCKSNAMMRCCKDLGVASDLWDPRWIRKFLKSHAREAWAEQVNTKKRKKIWLRKDDEVKYPFKEVKMGA